MEKLMFLELREIPLFSVEANRDKIFEFFIDNWLGGKN